MGSFSCCSQSSDEANTVIEISRILKVVSEASRLKILCVLRQGEHCVCEMMEHLDMSQSLISHHLRDLRDAGLVVDQKNGLRVHYMLTEKGTKITNLIFQIEI